MKVVRKISHQVIGQSGTPQAVLSQNLLEGKTCQNIEHAYT